MTQFGMYSQTTPRNDASPTRGQWNLADAYRYISEAYGGYHFNAMHGINVQAGIFMSYVGLFSYYNFDNWAYQPSYVSSNTPWFFNGMRVQIFPTEKLKIEPQSAQMILDFVDEATSQLGKLAIAVRLGGGFSAGRHLGYLRQAPRGAAAAPNRSAAAGAVARGYRGHPSSAPAAALSAIV